jgi:DAK2 domain fusion protein YloV
MPKPLSLDLFQRWCEACVEALGAAREEIDALNVFPVPDSDTGTNLFLTLEAASQAASTVMADAGADRSDEAATLVRAGRAFVDGALRGARGNSGVIMSQLLRGMVVPLLQGRAPDGSVQADVFARSLGEAAAAAHAAVGEPVEGTILSVARAAADAAATLAAAGGSLEQVVTGASEAARVALARTPEQMERLRRAGVVDAGGRGLVVLLDATVRVMTGRWSPDQPVPGRPARHIPTPLQENDLTPGGPAYEVMYLLDATEDDVATLRTALAELGDSLVVVGGDGLWNVHVHVDDVGAAIEAGVRAGRPHRIRVTHFAEQAAARAAEESRRQGRAVVVVAAGPGLRRLFEESGAHALLITPGSHCSTADFLEAFVGCGAAEVIVLPNDAGSVSAAEAAARQARELGLRVSVIPTRAQVQGLAAVAVHEPGRSFDADVVAMTAAAGHTRHGAVTRARERAMTMAGPCEPGDVLGVVEGDFVVVGGELDDVVRDVVTRLLNGGGELLTLVTGQGAPPHLTEAVEAAVRATRPEIDTVVFDGGQDRYPLLVAVE